MPAPLPVVGWPLTTAQGELVAILAGLIQRAGADRFIKARVIGATTADFPEPWTPTMTAMHRLLYRVAWHAFLDVEIVANDIRAARPPERRMLKKSEVELLSAVPGTATFDVAQLGNDDVAGRAAHAIGDAFLALAPVDPFRDAGREVTAAEASTAAVYVGLGVLVANSSMYRRSASEMRGRAVVSEEYIEETGGLPLADATLLLAIQDLVRDEHSPALATLLPPQAEWFERWLDVLDPHEDELRALLGLADASPGPVLARPAAPREPAAAVERSLEQFNVGQKTFRIPERGHGRLWLGFLGGAAAFAIPGIGLVAGPFAMVAGGIGGWLLGARYFVCSDPNCRHHMPTAEPTCPGCGGTILETIKHASLRLERLEAYEGVPDEPA